MWGLKIEDGGKKYEIQDYIRKTDTGWVNEFYINNEEGEGMSLSEKELFDIFDKYFKKEF